MGRGEQRCLQGGGRGWWELETCDDCWRCCGEHVGGSDVRRGVSLWRCSGEWGGIEQAWGSFFVCCGSWRRGRERISGCGRERVRSERVDFRDERGVSESELGWEQSDGVGERGRGVWDGVDGCFV